MTDPTSPTPLPPISPGYAVPPGYPQGPPTGSPVPAPVAAVARTKPWYLRWWTVAAAAVASLVVVAGLAAPDRSAGARDLTGAWATPASTTPPTVPTSAGPPTIVPTTDSPKEAPPTTQAPPPKPALPADLVFQGRGAKVIRLKLSDDHLHVATFTHQGSRNFIVEAVDSGGDMVDLLVNDIGRYTGTKLLDVRETPAALKVEADGAWKIVVKVAQKAPVWPGTSSGKGATVLRVTGATGLTTVSVTHGGERNFAIWAYGEDSDLLVNEIGRYSGEVLLPDGTVLLDIEADGAWTIKRSG